jgi:DNA polymerase (family 10)
VTDEVNNVVAGRLEEVARLLEEQGANRFRVDAYLNAARLIRRLDQPVSDLVRSEGIEGLRRLKGIGDNLAQSVHQLVMSGRLPMLERLRGESDPISLLCTVPGIGKVTAQRLHDHLEIDSLEELEAVAADGRLASIGGLGRKRIAGIRDSLATRLGRIRVSRPDRQLEQPPVAEILDVDREYRSGAAKGVLPRIAPKRFNPSRASWLPILHTARSDRHYTAVFSNTARAHQLGRTNDWVVIYYDAGSGERQCTVITARRGLLDGKRIVRGREAECSAYYFPDSPLGEG